MATNYEALDAFSISKLPPPPKSEKGFKKKQPAANEQGSVNNTKRKPPPPLVQPPPPWVASPNPPAPSTPPPPPPKAKPKPQAQSAAYSPLVQSKSNTPTAPTEPVNNSSVESVLTSKPESKHRKKGSSTHKDRSAKGKKRSKKSKQRSGDTTNDEDAEPAKEKDKEKEESSGPPSGVTIAFFVTFAIGVLFIIAGVITILHYSFASHEIRAKLRFYEVAVSSMCAESTSQLYQVVGKRQLQAHVIKREVTTFITPLSVAFKKSKIIKVPV